jgi:hypothetical protein
MNVNTDEENNFVVWLSLQMKHTTAKDRARTLRRLCNKDKRLKRLLVENDDEKDLLDYIITHIIKQNKTFKHLYTTKKYGHRNHVDYDHSVLESSSEESGEDENDDHSVLESSSEESGEDENDADDDEINDDTESTNTTSMKIVAMVWYRKFLGKHYQDLERLKTVLLLQSRHIEQSTIISNIYIHMPILRQYNQLISYLQFHQIHVDAILTEYFNITTMININMSVFQKTCFHYIQPFLYLTFLLCERPVDHLTYLQFFNSDNTASLASNRYTLTRDEIHLLRSRSKIQKFIYNSENDRKDWKKYTRLYIDNNGDILICFIVKGTHTKHNIYRIQTYVPNHTLAWYIYVYACIRKRFNISKKSLSVFTGPRNGKWVTKLKDIKNMLLHEPIVQLRQHNHNERVTNILSYLHLRTTRSHKRFYSTIKLLWFITKLYSNKSINDNSSIYIPMLKHIHTYGTEAELGFVTSSHMSKYYNGPQWLISIGDAVDWWSDIFQIDHNKYNNDTLPYKIKSILPLQHRQEFMYHTWKNIVSTSN